MESKPNLARDWWEAALALLAIVFAVRAFFSLIAIWKPVPPTLEQDLLFFLVLLAGACAIGALVSRRFTFAARLLPYRRTLLFVALGAGTLLALWAVAGLPVHLAADRAYADDGVCANLNAKETNSALCRSTDGRAIAAFFDPQSNAYFISVLDGEAISNVQLDCPGDKIFALTVATTRAVRIGYYGGRIARLGAGGLICETSFAPSPAATAAFVINAAFGLLVAIYAFWALWGERIRSWRAGRRERSESILPKQT